MHVVEHRLWTRTLDRYIRAGLSESVVSRLSGPPPVTTQNRTKIKDTNPILGYKLKSLPRRDSSPDRWVGRMFSHIPAFCRHQLVVFHTHTACAGAVGQFVFFNDRREMIIIILYY